jgi:hypothetical protein
MIFEPIHDHAYTLNECVESSSRNLSIGLIIVCHARGIDLLAMDDEGKPSERLSRSPIARLTMAWDEFYGLSAQELADAYKKLIDMAVSVRLQPHMLNSYALRAQTPKRITG